MQNVAKRWLAVTFSSLKRPKRFDQGFVTIISVVFFSFFLRFSENFVAFSEEWQFFYYTVCSLNKGIQIREFQAITERFFK